MIGLMLVQHGKHAVIRLRNLEFLWTSLIVETSFLNPIKIDISYSLLRIIHILRGMAPTRVKYSL